MWPFRRRERRIKLSDRVWLTQEAKLAAIVREIEQEAAKVAGVVVVSHFADALVGTCLGLEQAGIAFERVERMWNSADSSRLLDPGSPGVFVVPSMLLPKADPDGAMESAETDSPEIFVLVAERHPLLDQDDQVERFAAGLSRRARIRFHVSFEDGLLKVFAREWVAPMMKMLGLEENECVESGMVTRHIRGAQKKFSKRALGRVIDDSIAESSEDWIQRNFPDGG